MGYESRKYVDLILKASAKWATLEPFKRRVEPGDYGIVDSETGEFEFHGSIYKNQDILDRIPDLKTESYKPFKSSEIEKWVISAMSTKQLDADLGPSASVLGIVEASIKVQFSFKRGTRGAFLVMYRPQSIDLPKDILLHKLYNLPELKGKFLVTSIIACPAYSLYLSTAGAEKVGVAFTGSLPVAAAPGISVGGGVSVGWVSENTTGFYQEGVDLGGQPKYVPLLSLKLMRSPNALLNMFRDITPPPPIATGDDLWIDADHTRTPWSPLDEDGQEDDFVDDVMS